MITTISTTLYLAVLVNQNKPEKRYIEDHIANKYSANKYLELKGADAGYKLKNNSLIHFPVFEETSEEDK